MGLWVPLPSLPRRTREALKWAPAQVGEAKKAQVSPRCSMPCHDWGQGCMCLILGYPAPRWPLTPLSSQIRCMLNIWGVILYLRLPWITAQAGIGECCLWGAGEGAWSSQS